MLQGTHLDDLLAWAEARAQPLMRAVGRLDDEARAELVAYLERFDRDHDGSLTEYEAWLAARILNLLYRLSRDGIALVTQALDLLDINANARVEADEVALAVEIFEMFCKADSLNDTLSNKELRMLLAVLKHCDTDHNGVLDSEERAALRDALWTPDAFLEEQKKTNPHLKGLL